MSLIIDMTFVNVMLTFVIVAVCKLFFKINLSDMGLGGIKRFSSFLYGLLFGAASFSAVFLLVLKSVKVTQFNIEKLFTIDMLVWFIIFIIVGFQEEILCRGVVIALLRKKRNINNKWILLTMSSALFSILHISNNGINMLAIINLFAAGFLLGYLYLKSGSLWLSIGFHITWNFVQGNIFGVSVSGLRVWHSVIYSKLNGSDFITGGDFGPEASICATAILLLGNVYIHFFMSNEE